MLAYMGIATTRLETQRSLAFHFNERIKEKLPGTWSAHEYGSLSESLFKPPDGYIQEVHDDRVEGITPQNYHLKKQIESLKAEYLARGLHDGTVFTLQAMGTGRVIDEVSALTIERTSMGAEWPYALRPNDRLAVLVFGMCSYFEQVAMAEGAIEGMKPTYGTLISSLTRTSDNFLVFARRLGSAEGKLGVIGGTLNEDEQSLGNGVYEVPDAAMASEVSEELGISRSDFSVHLKAVLSDSIKNKQGQFYRPVLFFDTDIAMSRRKLANAFINDSHARKEHSELVFVENNMKGILSFMKTYSPEDLHPPADAVLAVALERATGVRVI